MKKNQAHRRAKFLEKFVICTLVIVITLMTSAMAADEIQICYREADAGSEIEISLNSAVMLTVNTTLSEALTWSSSAPEVATVSSSGLVEPHSLGSTVITCASSLDSSVKDTVTIVVEKPQYTIYWKVGEDVTSQKVEEGQIPSFTGSTEKESSQTSNFRFTGWQPDVEPASRDITYTAIYEITTRQYTITWDVDGNRTTQQYEFGQMPTYNSTPVKAANGTTVYTFIGWSPSVTTVRADATYTALFSSNLQQYTITFKDYDGSVLKRIQVEAGTVPSYGSMPSRGADYTFIGWSPTLKAATGDATYVAEYEKKDGAQKPENGVYYTATFLDGNGNLLAEYEVPAGTKPAYTEETPMKTMTASARYTFTGWSPELAPIEEDTTYRAVFSSIPATKYTLKKAEMTLGKESTFDIPFPAATLRFTKTAMDKLKELDTEVTFTVTTPTTKDTGTIKLELKKAGGSTVTTSIPGLLLITSKLSAGNVATVATGISSSFHDVQEALYFDGTWYIPIPGVCSVSTRTTVGTWPDVTPGYWAYDHINHCYTRGVMVGISATQFSPNTYVTRGQVATILYNMADNQEIQGGTAYNDVPPDYWCVRPVLWSSSKKILPGSTQSEFFPRGICSREDMVTGLYNYAVSEGVECDTSAKLGTYTDAGEIASSKLDAWRWAVGNGIVNGTSGTTLSPASGTTRAQMAAILDRFFTYMMMQKYGFEELAVA